MTQTFNLILVSLLLPGVIFDITCDAQYCKPPGKRMYDNGECTRCKKCQDGNKTNHDEVLLHDDRHGYLECYMCTPCQEGTYSNSDTRIGRKLQCQQWINCTEMNMVYDILPNSTYIGKCGGCLTGYFPKRPFNICVRCTLESHDKPECKHLTRSTNDEVAGPNKKANKSVLGHPFTKNGQRPVTIDKSGPGTSIVTIVLSSLGVVTVLITGGIVYRLWRKKRSSEGSPSSSVLHSFDSINKQQTDPLLGVTDVVNILRPLTNVIVDIGNTAKLECATSHKSLKATWYRNDIILPDDQRISTSSSDGVHLLSIRFVNESDSGIYTVKFPHGISSVARISAQDKYALSDEEKRRCEDVKLCKEEEKRKRLNSLISTRIPSDYHDRLYNVLLCGYKHIMHTIKGRYQKDLQYQCCRMLDRLVEVKGSDATLYYLYSKLCELLSIYIDDMNDDAVRTYSHLLDNIKSEYIMESVNSTHDAINMLKHADNDKTHNTQDR